MTLRRSDVCCSCGARLAVGTRAGWDTATRTVRCLSCVESSEVAVARETSGATAPTPEHAVPAAAPQVRAQRDHGGASAQQEYDRRSQRRQQRILLAHPRLGGVILALSAEPTSTRVWAQGAGGERAVAAKLDGLADVVVLHDRSLRRAEGGLSRANVDHIVVAPSGVWVIDAKTHRGALEVRRSGGLFSPRVEKLFIGGRDRSGLVEGLAKQVAAVSDELARVGAPMIVRGALCFVGTELPWFGSSHLAEVPLVGRRGLGKLLAAPGDLTAQDREVIAQYLHGRFPPAVR